MNAAQTRPTYHKSAKGSISKKTICPPQIINKLTLTSQQKLLQGQNCLKCTENITRNDFVT